MYSVRCEADVVMTSVMYHLPEWCDVIEIRRLAAVDIAFLGSQFILAEFSIGVFGSLGVGVLTLVRTHSLGGTVFGAYLLCIGVNYVPLLVHAIDLVRHDRANRKLPTSYPKSTECFRKYRRQ